MDSCLLLFKAEAEGMVNLTNTLPTTALAEVTSKEDTLPEVKYECSRAKYCGKYPS